MASDIIHVSLLHEKRHSHCEKKKTVLHVHHLPRKVPLFLLTHSIYPLMKKIIIIEKSCQLVCSLVHVEKDPAFI